MYRLLRGNRTRYRIRTSRLRGKRIGVPVSFFGLVEEKVAPRENVQEKWGMGGNLRDRRRRSTEKESQTRTRSFGITGKKKKRIELGFKGLSWERGLDDQSQVFWKRTP